MALADDLLAVLDDPTHMWTHALKELSADAQRLFLTLTLLPKPASSDVLQVAYTSQTASRSESFLDSLRSLEDSFINIEKRYADLRAVSFRNPSLQDFAYVYLNDNPEWLDSLLSAPQYFEQIANAFSLAMAQTALVIDSQTRSRKEAPPKYPGIKNWIGRQASLLIEIAVELLSGARADIYYDPRRSRFNQLLEIIAIYGKPTKDDVLCRLREVATLAINPVSKESARLILELLNKPAYRKLLDTLIEGDAGTVMRRNILDKDSWKFSILAGLDELLELDAEETWESWGGDYMGYARQLAEELADSDDDDDLRVAIEELTAVGNMLGMDFYTEIAALEEKRSNLPEEDDYDDRGSRIPPPRSVDASPELDDIFASLL